MEKYQEIKTPESYSEITAEWLNKIIFPEATENKIASMEIDKNFGPWSLLGKAIRVKLDYFDKENGPDSVIVKFQVACSDKEKEGQIYQLLSNVGVSYLPKLYGKFGYGNLVIEDLSPTHSVIKDDLSVAQIENVVSTLTDINNRFSKNSRVPKDHLSHFVNSININMEQSWDIFREKYHEQLGPDVAAFEWMQKNPEIVSKHYASDPASLNHGDVNKSNMLFPNDKRDKPILIDWQLAGQKVLPFDLSYFLVKSLSTEQRRKHEDALLKEYYGQLSKDTRSNYDYDKMVLDYRACVTRSMLSAVTRVGPKFNSQPESFKEPDELANRVIAAVKDLKPVEAIQELQNNR